MSLHFKQLITAEDLATLQDIANTVERERKLVEFHSNPVSETRVAQAVRAFAEDPTADNMKRVREETTLGMQDHSLIQQRAMQRLDACLQSRMPPVGVRIYEAAIKLLDVHIARMVKHDEEMYAEWNLSPVPSAMEAELRRLRSGFANQLTGYLGGRGPNGGLCELPKLIVQHAELHAEARAAKAAK